MLYGAVRRYATAYLVGLLLLAVVAARVASTPFNEWRGYLLQTKQSRLTIQVWSQTSWNCHIFFIYHTILFCNPKVKVRLVIVEQGAILHVQCFFLFHKQWRGLGLTFWLRDSQSTCSSIPLPKEFFKLSNFARSTIVGILQGLTLAMGYAVGRAFF